MQTFIGIQPIHHFEGAVFRIPTNRGDVFMYEQRTNYMNSERAVVEVDAEKFLNLWRQRFSSHKEVAVGDPATWPNDSKFHWPDKHFAEGIKNPVPLAEVGCRMVKTETPIWRSRFYFFKQLEGVATSNAPALNFTDGVTRTIWLLTFGAKLFPVQCAAKDAPLLQELAGAPGGRYRTVDELIPGGATL